MKKYDVVIVGAGSAGLRAAKILGDAKKRVVVLEQKDFVGCKVCAAGLTIKDFRFGIPKTLVERSFNSVKLHFNGICREIKSTKDFVYTTNMENFSSWLAKEAENSGVEIITGCGVTKVKKGSVIAGEKEFGFKYLIGADGSNSIVRKYLGLPRVLADIGMQYIVKKRFKDMELFIDLDRFGLGYAWIFPYKKSTSIGVGCCEQKYIKTRDLKKNFDEWCEDFGLSIGELQSALINCTYNGHEFGNIFLAGDAGGFASGLTGEGMYYSMMSGEEIAKKICNKNYSCPKIKEILETKKRDNFLLKLMCLNKQLTKAEFKLLAFLLKYKTFSNKLINAFSYR